MTISSGARRQRVDHLAVPAAGRHAEAGDLVVEAAVAAVVGEVADQRVHHLDAGRAAAGLQTLHVGHDMAFHLVEEPAEPVLELGSVSGP